MKFHHAILPLSLSWLLKGFGWMETNKKDKSHTETEYFCSCLLAQGAYTVSPRFHLGPQIETISNPFSFRRFAFNNTGAEISLCRVKGHIWQRWMRKAQQDVSVACVGVY